MDCEDEFIFEMFFMLLLTATSYCSTKKRTRRYAVRPINKRRKEIGFFNNLLKSMVLHDHESFFKYTRMTPKLFHHLLRLVGPSLQKKNTTKNPIIPAHRLIMTLHYLAEGCSMQEIAWGHMVGHATVCKIIHETTEVLWKTLSSQYLKVPSTDEWNSIMGGFYRRWNIPNCLGAIDGKHITIQAPKFAGTTFFNYKKHHSIVLMASCDAFYRFTLVDVGAPGSNHDSVVFQESGFGNRILKNQMPLPTSMKLPNVDTVLPCFFCADAAFPLTQNIMRPYPGERLSNDKRIFNYRLSRARRTIENSFGILAQRWRILRKPIIADITTCENIVLATVVLHNYLQRSELEIPESDRKYCPTGFADTVLPDGTIAPGRWRDEPTALRSVGRIGSNNAKGLAKENRDRLCRYFISAQGYVPWQMATVMRGALPDRF